MAKENSMEHLLALLEAIKSAEVVESRTQMIARLRDWDIPKEFGAASLFEYLILTFWEDFTCLDESQCMLNKTILSVAAKHVDSDTSGYLPQFLALGMKASSWCQKHLKMTLMSTEESQEEEHCNLFFQLLLDLFRLSEATILSLTRYVMPGVFVETYILEQINLTRDVVSEIKRIRLCGSELLKASQTVLDAVVRLCKEYCQVVNWGVCNAELMQTEDNIDCKEMNLTDHAINLTKCTIEKLCQLGVIAAKDGGSLVAILNVSWKGVVTLLQLGEGALAKKVNVADIIVALISMVNMSLTFAAGAWSSSLKECISVTEARRTFLPVKFYLTNAVKIASLYACEAYQVYKEITLCVLTLSTFKVLLCHEQLLKTASEVFAELLEKTSLELLYSLLSSTQVKMEQKLELLDYLFIKGSFSISVDVNPTRSMTEIFSIGCENFPGARSLLLGRVSLFISFLRSSSDLEDELKVGIIRKLGWLLDTVIEEDTYSSFLVIKIPLLCSKVKVLEWDCQPFFLVLLDALKTYMIVVSSSLAWSEMEFFMLENLFHPHFLCWEIVMDLWCFLVRFAENKLVCDIFAKFCSLMKSLASESFLLPGSLLRRLAKSICMLLNNSTQPMTDFVYNCIVGDNTSQSSKGIFVALLLEGFPLNSLSVTMKSTAKNKIITDYTGFIEHFDDKLLRTCNSEVVAVPVFALSASVPSMQDFISDIDFKTLTFLVTLIRNFQSIQEKPMKNIYCKIFGETLVITSNMKHLYPSNEMEAVVMELHNLFITGSTSSDTQLYQTKQDLSLFMAGLGHMEMSETDNYRKSCAVWELYHMLFREKNWALVHLAIAAFGYFAARTSCNQLWRFVPQDAALSHDVVLGNEASEERFMSEFKAFLDKEVALSTPTPACDLLGILAKESLLLKEMVQKVPNISIDTTRCEGMDIDVENQSNKRQKRPDGIRKGMDLLQSGLKLIGDGISQCDQNCCESLNLQKFVTHFSNLEDLVTQLVVLADNGQPEFGLDS